MNDAVRPPVGLGLVACAVLAGAASLLPWRTGAGIEDIGGQVTLLLSIALGLTGAVAIRAPSDRSNWLVAFALIVLMLIVTVGQVATDAQAYATCDDVASCAFRVMAPAGVGVGLIAAIAGCLIGGTTALLGARRA